MIARFMFPLYSTFSSKLISNLVIHVFLSWIYIIWHGFGLSCVTRAKMIDVPLEMQKYAFCVGLDDVAKIYSTIYFLIWSKRYIPISIWILKKPQKICQGFRIYSSHTHSTEYNQWWNVNQVRSAQWTVQKYVTHTRDIHKYSKKIRKNKMCNKCAGQYTVDLRNKYKQGCARVYIAAMMENSGYLTVY